MAEYAALAKRLTDPEKKIFGTANAANADGQQMFSLMWNYGRHYWVNPEETKSWSTPRGPVEMFKAFQDMQFKDQSLPWTGNPYRTEFGFNQGAAAMSIQYYSTASYTLAQTFERRRHSFDWQMGTFPKGPRDQQHFSQGHIWTVAKGRTSPTGAGRWPSGWGAWRRRRCGPRRGAPRPRCPAPSCGRPVLQQVACRDAQGGHRLHPQHGVQGEGGQLPVLAHLRREPAHHDARPGRHLRREAGAPQGGHGRRGAQIDEVLRTAPQVAR